MLRVDGRGDDEDHQRNLEVQIGQGQAPEAQQVEAGLVEVDADDLPRQPAGEEEELVAYVQALDADVLVLCFMA